MFQASTAGMGRDRDIFQRTGWTGPKGAIGDSFVCMREACQGFTMNAEKAKPLRAWLVRNGLWLGLYAVLGGWLCAAFFAGPMLPWRDLPDHLALISLLDHARVAGSVAADHYQIQGQPVPYWLFYGSVWLLARAMSYVGAMQVVAALGLLATPLALGALLRSVGRDWRWGVLALPLFFNHNLMYGWVSFCLGVPVLFMALAALIRLLDQRGSPVALGLWACLLFLAHAQLAALFAILTVYAVVRRGRAEIWTSIKRVAAPLATPVVLGMPWVIARLMGSHSRGENTDGPAVIFHDPVTRLKRLPDYLTNCWSGNSDDWMGLATIALVVLLVRLRPPTGLMGHRDRRIASGLVGITAALYLIAPWELRWPTNQWAIYNRFAMIALTMAPLLIEVPFPRHLWRDRRWPALWLTAAWALVVANFGADNRRVYAEFNERNAFVLEAVRSMEPNQRILPLVQDASDAASHLGAADQFHAYYIIEHGGYDPYLFDNPSHPVVHRAEVKPTVPPWNRPHRNAALRALKGWAKAEAGKDRGFAYVIEQRGGQEKRRLSKAYEPPERIGRWVIHKAKSP